MGAGVLFNDLFSCTGAFLMRFYRLFFLVMFAPAALAVQVVVEDPCNKERWLDTQVALEPGASIGMLTVEALERNEIPFSGSEGGINSIKGTVSGDDALEIISETELRAYGWCFTVNHVESTTSSDRVVAASNQDVITWFFAFAHYESGNWTEMCKPTKISRPAYICH
jgi:hypothetical protein